MRGGSAVDQRTQRKPYPKNRKAPERLIRPRISACKDCGCAIEHFAATGKLPERCDSCKRANFARRTREKYVVKHPSGKLIAECEDCCLQFEKSVRATTRVCCERCSAIRAKVGRRRYAHEHRQNLNEASRIWRKNNPGLVNSRKHRRRAGERAAAEIFPREEIFERDAWVCGLCSGPVDPELKFPDHGSASIDHIIAISKGGKHTRANTQLAHLQCNRVKGAG